MEVGTPFDNFDAVVQVAADHASQHGYSFSVDKRDKKRLVLSCRAVDCPFHLRAIVDRHQICKITQLNTDHTCVGNLQEARGSQNAKNWVSKTIEAGMVVTSKTTPGQIRAHMRQQHGNVPSYSTALRVKEDLLSESADDQREQFRMFRSYCAALQVADPQTTAIVKASTIRLPAILPDSAQSYAQHFHSVFICTGSAKHLWSHNRKFLAMDGTFTKNRFIQTLLLACTMDSENKLVVLAWALVPNECEETWTWFLQHLSDALPTLNTSQTVIVNDREKGLINALETQTPDAYPAWCCYHIAANVQSKFGLKIKRLFWRCVYADTEAKFLEHWSEIQTTNAAAAAYIDDIPHERWASYAVTGRRFGHVTSNLAEIANALLREIRTLPALEMVHSIYLHQMGRFYDRAQASLAWRGTLTPSVAETLRKNIQESRSFTPHPATTTDGVVVSTRNAKQYAVNLPNGTNSEGRCSCKEFQQMWIPCEHACAFGNAVRASPVSLVASVYSTENYRATYGHPYAPVALEDQVKDDLNPPLSSALEADPRLAARRAECRVLPRLVPLRPTKAVALAESRDITVGHAVRLMGK